MNCRLHKCPDCKNYRCTCDEVIEVDLPPEELAELLAAEADEVAILVERLKGCY